MQVAPTKNSSTNIRRINSSCNNDDWFDKNTAPVTSSLKPGSGKIFDYLLKVSDMMADEVSKSPSIDRCDKSKNSKGDKQVIKYVEKVARNMTTFSNIIDSESPNNTIPVFDRTEIELGSLLGSGGFNDVYELKNININSKSTSKEKQKTSRRRSLLSKKILSFESTRARDAKQQFAVKFLQRDIHKYTKDFQDGAADLYMETKYLVSLTQKFSHPNIISIHGMSTSGVDGFLKQDVEGPSSPPGYFIVLDRLVDTLENRLEIWKQFQYRLQLQAEYDTTKDSYTSNDAQHMLDSLFVQQLRVAKDISSALSHLHSINMIFRDLKPDNVGFDENGVVKLFDFGVAREIDPGQLSSHGRGKNINLRRMSNEDLYYNMTCQVGTLRYMAPEVQLGLPYNLSADVYSFGMLLWQIMTLEKPFADIENIDEFVRFVVRGNERPELCNCWSNISLCKLITRCWSKRRSKRPSMRTIAKVLKQEVAISEEMIGIPSREANDPAIDN